MADETQETALRKVKACEVVLDGTPPPPIVGLDSVMQVARDVQLERQHPELFQGALAARTGTSMLLFGPPGCGKTMVATTVAHVLGAYSLFRVSASTLTGMFYGQAEAAVAALFHEATERATARKRLVVIFLDELDALMGTRGGAKEDGSDRKLLTQTLTSMNALHRDVLVVGATNRPQDIDAAVRRRFPFRLHVPLPSAAVRTALIATTLQAGIRHTLSDDALSVVADRTDGFSCDDLHRSIVAAGRTLVLESIDRGDRVVAPLTIDHLLNAVAAQGTSVDPSDTEQCLEWDQRFGTSVTLRTPTPTPSSTTIPTPSSTTKPTPSSTTKRPRSSTTKRPRSSTTKRPRSVASKRPARRRDDELDAWMARAQWTVEPYVGGNGVTKRYYLPPGVTRGAPFRNRVDYFDSRALVRRAVADGRFACPVP